MRRVRALQETFPDDVERVRRTLGMRRRGNALTMTACSDRANGYTLSRQISVLVASPKPRLWSFQRTSHRTAQTQRALRHPTFGLLSQIYISVQSSPEKREACQTKMILGSCCTCTSANRNQAGVDDRSICKMWISIPSPNAISIPSVPQPPKPSELPSHYIRMTRWSRKPKS
jgi:hypothetical protein